MAPGTRFTLDHGLSTVQDGAEVLAARKSKETEDERGERGRERANEASSFVLVSSASRRGANCESKMAGRPTGRHPGIRATMGVHRQKNEAVRPKAKGTDPMCLHWVKR